MANLEAVDFIGALTGKRTSQVKVGAALGEARNTIQQKAQAFGQLAGRLGLGGDLFNQAAKGANGQDGKEAAALAGELKGKASAALAGKGELLKSGGVLVLGLLAVAWFISRRK